ncbi:DUF2071 domain-containing protein [Streptomyces sp. V2I9]|uniref:DUF2071 domain-containing protein n=1 Tax=Streptomyces sp. V2I9 TaxID=3042304 RepID=UPI002789548D|nr:DUF2071 domain-containing protein [Streptomyces sp. V2I9]MDQ0988712.1 uncharacterized protein YqjF (DUF2071 family) [Streptomyces sp. V2I9]
MERRPGVRWHHAAADLADFAIVSWAADPARVAALLPDGFEPDVREGVTLVSLVAFRDHRFHFRFAPPAALSAGQVNYRTYVRHAGQSGVWFFGTSLGSRLVHLPATLWKMPWYHERVEVRATWEGDKARTWRLRTHGDWGAAGITLRGRDRPQPPPPGFATADEVSRILTDPALGWYARRDGSGVGRYSVWHEPLMLEDAEVESAHSQVFTDLGLISPGQAPCHAGLQRHSVFDIHTPPRRQLAW